MAIVSKGFGTGTKTKFTKGNVTVKNLLRDLLLLLLCQC